jgi:hypothetical protein
LRGKPPLAALIRLEAAFAKVLHRFAMLLRGDPSVRTDEMKERFLKSNLQGL